MLKNIKRRSKYNKQPQVTIAIAGSTNSELESEIETLKQDQNSLKKEILKLRQEQDDSYNHLTTLEERIRYAECKHQKMIFFLIRAAKNPTFVHNLMQKKNTLKRELDGFEISKRRRLLPNSGPKNLASQINEEGYFESVNKNIHQMKSQLPTKMDVESCSLIKNKKANVICGASDPDMSSVYYEMSENLLDENLNSDQELAVNDSKLYHEFEDLISKPQDWGGYFNSLVEQRALGMIFFLALFRFKFL